MLKLLALFLFLGFVSAAPKFEDIEDDFELPPGTITCQIDSPDRDDCIKEAIQDMLPKLANGMESLRIPSLEPYRIESQTNTFNFGGGSFNVSLSGTVRKVNIFGLSTTKIIDLKTNITRKHISKQITAYVPQGIAEGYYSGEAQFNNLKIKSKGRFNVTGTDIKLVSHSEGDIIEVNGKEYVKVTKLDVAPEFGGLKVFATGLFPDPQLNKAILDFVNQYWPSILEEMLPILRAKTAPQLIKDANKFLLHVPLRKMLYYGDESA